MEMLLAPVVLFEDSAEVGGFRLARQSVEMQRHADQHPLAEVADRGLEDRPRGQAGIELDFGHVLVLELKPVELERRRLARLIGLDHRLAAARIAADRADRDGLVLGDHAGIHQRAQKRDRAGRMAARIADLAGFGDRLPLPRDELRKAIGPAGRDPMGGRGVDHAGRVRAHGVDETRRLFGRLVRQAKDHDIDFAVELLLGGRVLARLGRQD